MDDDVKQALLEADIIIYKALLASAELKVSDNRHSMADGVIDTYIACRNDPNHEIKGVHAINISSLIRICLENPKLIKDKLLIQHNMYLGDEDYCDDNLTYNQEDEGESGTDLT